MKNAKKIAAVVVGVAAACLLSACGGGAGGGGYYGSGSYSGGGSSGGGGFGLGFGCLEVLNDLESGAHDLVLVQLRDVDTDEILREEPVLVEAGEDVDLMDLPAGEYRVVGFFDDGLFDPMRGDVNYDVVVDPVVEAVITFRHP